MASSLRLRFRLAVAITASSGDEFIAVRHSPPPPLTEDEYRLFSDSDLWDLPSAPLAPLSPTDLSLSDVAIQGAEAIAQSLQLSRFDFGAALHQVLEQVGLSIDKSNLKLMLLKFVEEAEFGPGPPINTLFVSLPLDSKEVSLKDSCKWVTKQNAFELLSGVKPCADRVGPLAYIGYLSQSNSLPNKVADSPLLYQEYPPGVTVVPMKSGTIKPFSTTNLVVFLAKKSSSGLSNSGSSIYHADALIMDPGCKIHAQLSDLISSLPGKLLVFITHHHHDHVEGLSIVQKINPEATLLAHEKTISRIHGNWSGACIGVSGGENIFIGDQQLKVIFAPGHTDGHLALLHVGTNSLIVGDHCVGEGSAVLDVTSGGNMKDYFDTTYKFIDLSPHILIPMHGRMNLWPKRMLCGYLKHRRDREARILKSIENGASSMFDIVSDVYSDVDKKLWIAASSNVRLHVDFLNYQNKLPKGFSVEKFKASCGVAFILRWLCACIKSRLNTPLVAAITIGGSVAITYAMKKK
ncbi:Hydroxyacylglutathione hydrolase [Rhynchospora pubera]|uniref:Hydroxyacylglutathione hydrolase n=1 Tax=Rhynchospora pubera TaxID=906938 RepID=A0AAV8CAF0_9POAL|nr:Hydroxyacylglutathione hydrolase [Rhynchospora pubera]